MNKKDNYKKQLADSPDWIKFLADNSNLPGPRGNLELLAAFIEVGNESVFLDCLNYDELMAPTNTPGEFIATCGAAGIGMLIANGKEEYFTLLRKLASDSRWRVREGVAFGLQAVGKRNFKMLIPEMNRWKNGNFLVQRAVVAGLCEPELLKDEKNADYLLAVLFYITSNVQNVINRKDPTLNILKKGLGYGLSVAVAACPDKGKKIFEQLVKYADKDIRWILWENLKKNRLIKMDKSWVDQMKKAIS
jgi:hypothetical protein